MAGFQRATKHEAKLRMALAGPSGSGKTYSALAIATALADGGTVAVVDTEHGSASKYADLFAFDVLELDTFHPQKYVEAIRDAQADGYSVVVLDSLTHAWQAVLELVDKEAARSGNPNSFAAWKKVTPIQNSLVEAILSANLHIIATVRSKQEYVQEKNEKNQTVIRKVGMAPQQRDGLEYEFDVFGELDQTNTLIVSKSRCPELSEAVIAKPGKQVADVLKKWLSGAPAPAPRPVAPEPIAEPTRAPAAPKAKSPERQTIEKRYAQMAEHGRKVGLEPKPLLDEYTDADAERRYDLLAAKVQELTAAKEPVNAQ